MSPRLSARSHHRRSSPRHSSLDLGRTVRRFDWHRAIDDGGPTVVDPLSKTDVNERLRTLEFPHNVIRPADVRVTRQDAQASRHFFSPPNGLAAGRGCG
jgi:hypothetical protein